MRILATFASLR